jgi:hypothetical protein
MSRKLFTLVIGLGVGLATATLPAADYWKSAQVLPKDPNQLTLRGNSTRPGSEYVGNAYQLSWPARVEKVNGQWILIGDKGAYSVPPVKGWVRKDEMLCIRDDGSTTQDDPSIYLPNKILEATDPATRAALYWLNGIYSEGEHESEAAIRDYTAAIRTAFGQNVDATLPSEPVTSLFNPSQGTDAAQAALTRFPGLADAYLRMAKLSTRGSHDDSTAANGQASSTPLWKTYYACAEALFRAHSEGATPKMPGLETEWADALTADYDRLLIKHATFLKQNKQLLASRAPRDRKAQAQAEAQVKDLAKQVADAAADADAHYKNALAANPAWTNAFLGRGKFLLSQGIALKSTADDDNVKQSRKLFDSAMEHFTLAIQLEPKSKQAHQNRAEGYMMMAGHPQLKSEYQQRARYLTQAAQSADTASQLGKDRDPESLELWAKIIESEGEVYNDMGNEYKDPNGPLTAASLYKQAYYYWKEAASCPNADHARLQVAATRCHEKAGLQQKSYTLIASTSKRGDDDAPKMPQLHFYAPGSNLFRDKSAE